jgi:hypothetical protein
MGITITEVLNNWDSYGVFSYVLPFLIIFAVVFGILQKSKIFGEAKEVKGINAVLAVAIGLTSLQFDFVSTFFATIFPRFGVGLSILLVLIIFLGLFLTDDDRKKSHGGLKAVGWIVGVLVVFWALSEWNFWGDSFGLGYWLQDYFWTIIIVIAIVGGIIGVMKGGKSS